MKNRKKKKKGAAVQELLGVKTFSDYGIVTNRGELLYYLVTAIGQNDYGRKERYTKSII